MILHIYVDVYACEYTTYIYLSIYIYIYIYIGILQSSKSGIRNNSVRTNHHHHVVLVARISLTLSRHFSLSFIASDRSSGQHPVSSHSCWMYVRAGRPAFARPCVGVHKSTSLMSSSLLLQQYPACLVRLTWIVFVIGGRWPYNSKFEHLNVPGKKLNVNNFSKQISFQEKKYSVTLGFKIYFHPVKSIDMNKKNTKIFHRTSSGPTWKIFVAQFSPIYGPHLHRN